MEAFNPVALAKRPERTSASMQDMFGRSALKGLICRGFLGRGAPGDHKICG